MQTLTIPHFPIAIGCSCEDSRDSDKGHLVPVQGVLWVLEQKCKYKYVAYLIPPKPLT